MNQKINYRNAEECLHATYKDMEGMTLDDAVFILSEPVRKYHEAMSDKERINLPRARIIKAYELLINKAKQPDMREKVKEYIAELNEEIKRCMTWQDDHYDKMGSFKMEAMCSRVEALQEVRNDLKSRLEELI